MTKVIREFVKRATDKSAWDGTVGKVEFAAPDGDWTLDGVKLGADSVAYLMTFALQAFQDAYAGAASLAEAQGNFAKKLTAVKEGTMGQRTGGGASEATLVARSIVKGLLKAKYGKDSAEFKALDDAKLDEVFAKNEAKLRPQVDAELERRRKEREAKAKLGAGIELDI